MEAAARTLPDQVIGNNSLSDGHATIQDTEELADKDALLRKRKPGEFSWRHLEGSFSKREAILTLGFLCHVVIISLTSISSLQ